MSKRQDRLVGLRYEEIPEPSSDLFLLRCREAVRERLPALLEELFAKVDGVLNDLADKSERNGSYAACFEAMRVLRRERESIQRRFLSRLEAASDALVAGSSTDEGTGPTVPRQRDFALVDHGEPEESLIVANLISKAENRYRSELSDLRRHLAALLGRESIDSRTDPLGPFAICNAFRAALQPAEDLSLDIKLIVYKLFDRQVMDQLGGFYGCCTECVSASRTEPGVAGGDRARSSADQMHDSGFRAPRTNAAASASARRASSVFEDLRRVLGSRRDDIRNDSGSIVVGRGELMSALSYLQRLDASAGKPSGDSRDPRSRLREALHLRPNGAGGRRLEPRDEDALDSVFLLFESILRCNELPEAVKGPFSRLQIPIAKLALIDESFFENALHPARRLLDRLAQASIGLTDDGDRSPGEVYCRIEGVVTQILEGFELGSAIFGELDAELAAFLEREREETRNRESKARMELEGRERYRGARDQVREVIAKRLRAHAPLPPPISDLLYEGWQEVMLAIYLRNGPEGEEWRRAVSTIDRLIWSIQPKTEYEDRRELLGSIPALLRTLRESLAGISYDQRRLARWFKELQVLHIAALRGSGAAGVEPGSSSAGAQSPRPSDDSAAEPAGGEGEDFQPEVPGPFAVGTWIELLRDDGRTLRVRLAWISSESDVHLFVDRTGQRALELTGGELASLLNRRMVTILGNGEGLVDRAIENLLHPPKRG